MNMIVHFAELYYTHERTPKESHQGMWTTKVFLLQKTLKLGCSLYSSVVTSNGKLLLLLQLALDAILDLGYFVVHTIHI